MASCTSEFLVDMWLADLNSSAGGWYRLGSTFMPYSTTGANANRWPLALRVTVVVHDPTATGTLPEDRKRFQGYALQEVFYLGDR